MPPKPKPPKIQEPLAPSSGTQLRLFDFKDVQSGESRVLEIYDQLPRFVIRKKRESDSARIVSYRTKISGIDITVKIAPATIERNTSANRKKVDSVKPESLDSKHIYPGVREEIVERALRYLAVQNIAATTVGDTRTRSNVARVNFSLKQIRDHLAESNHTLDLNEIKEALQVLAGAMLIIESTDESVVQGFKASIIGNLSFDYKIGDETGERSTCSCELHPLAVRAILSNGYYTIQHNEVMRMRRFLSRWILTRMTLRFRQAEKPSFHQPAMGYTLRLSTILSESGIVPEPRMRDNIARVRESLQELESERALALGHGFEEKILHEPKQSAGRRRVLDVEWTLYPSHSFAETVITDNVKRSKRVLPPPDASSSKVRQDSLKL